MTGPFSFAYGNSTIECFPREDGVAASGAPTFQWYYRVNGGPEVRGPVAHHTDSRESVAFTVRELFKETRDAGAPVVGRALYRLAPGLYNMEPGGSPREWLQPGMCYEGHPVESSREADGVNVVLYHPSDPSAETALVWSKNLRRVEQEDCG